MAKPEPQLPIPGKARWLPMILIALICALVGVVTIYFAMAAGRAKNQVGLSLTPTSQKLYVGNDFTVTVLLNTNGQPVNAVQANIAYPTDKFTYVSTDTGTSAFSIQAESKQQAGLVKIARGSTTPVTGAQIEVARITFKPTITARKAAISFAAETAILSATTNANILTGTSSGQYSINP